jgi:hypothetical protein
MGPGGTGWRGLALFTKGDRWQPKGHCRNIKKTTSTLLFIFLLPLLAIHVPPFPLSVPRLPLVDLLSGF